MSRTVYFDRSKFDAQRGKLQSLFDRKLQRIKAETDRKIRDIAAEVAMTLGAITFPSAASIGMAVAAIRWDVRQVYATGGMVFESLKKSAGLPVANAFYAAYKRGDFNRATKILRSANSLLRSVPIGKLDPSLHESARGKNGRVVIMQPLQIVQEAELAAYLKVAVARLGKTASGWFACAEKLGGDGNAIRWKGTASHGSDGGTVHVQNSKERIRYIIRNTRPLAGKHISAGQARLVVQMGNKILTESLRRR